MIYLHAPHSLTYRLTRTRMCAFALPRRQFGQIRVPARTCCAASAAESEREIIKIS